MMADNWETQDAWQWYKDEGVKLFRRFWEDHDASRHQREMEDLWREFVEKQAAIARAEKGQE